MKNIKILFCIALMPLAAMVSLPAHADFPEDLNDVVFIEGPSGARVRGFAETSVLNVSVTPNAVNQFGRVVFLDYDKKNVWPGDFNGINANAWLFVQIGEIWYAGTWEFMRFGRIDRSEGAMVGPKHLRFAPLQNFRPVDGEVYGFMVTPVVRGGATPSRNERTNVSFYRWGEGPVSVEELFGGGVPVSMPAVNMLLEEDAPAVMATEE